MRLISKYRTQATVGIAPWQTTGGISYLALVASLACIYAIAAGLSLNVVVPQGNVSPLWLPPAIALCACLLFGLRVAPAVLLGAALVHWMAGMPILAALMIGCGNSLEAIVAALFIRQLTREPLDFDYTSNIFRFVGIAAVSSLIAATIGVAALASLHYLDMKRIVINWLTWWIGDATGIMIVVPLILAWTLKLKEDWKAIRVAELVTFIILLPTVTHIAFGEVLEAWSLSYLPIPFVIWAAFRFNLSSVTWATGTICAIVVWNTANGRGPLSIAGPNMSLLMLLAYISIVSATGLVLASLLCQRAAAEKKIKAERDKLEQTVQERTAELLNDIDERKRIEKELLAREQQLAQAQKLAQIGSWNWDVESATITWSDELYRIYGVDKATFDVTPAKCRSLIHKDDFEVLRRIVERSHRTGKPFHIEHRIILPSGAVKTVAARGFVSKDDKGRVVRMFGTEQDITEAKRAETALREAEERYRMVVELCPDAILVQQDGIITFGNQAAIALLAADGMGQIIGRSLFRFIDPDSHDIGREIITSLQPGEAVRRAEGKLVRLDGSEVDVDIHACSFMHKGRFAVLLIMRDITERKRSAEQMAYLAHYDSLTGLPNRALFHQRLSHALNIAERPGRSLEILFLDLDRFKEINDTLGHATGDLVLKETAERLQGILRESDTVARLGGDEFVVLVENVDEPHRGATIAGKILAAFASPFLRDREPLHITTSIGISSFPTDGIDGETLLKKADIAMYRAKESGRNNYRYYSAEMNIHTVERLTLEHALHHAIEENQLVLHYQPKVDVLSGRIIGMEALLRWKHPTMGWMSPDKFIPLAEKSGMIHVIGAWAIRTACMQNKLWQESFTERLQIAVNLSLLQLSDNNLVPSINQILKESELDPRYLELEIAESAVMANPEKTARMLNTLHDIGVGVTIDDFGTGQSCLAHLKQFPIQAVKIDRSFVRGIPHSRSDAAIARAIIGLAHSFECDVVAEGTETRQQFEFLREHDCNSVQGYYFSEPLNAHRFAELLHKQSMAALHAH
jgi:diguanylate cyclase (GGDEF)-like protein/PAS domain S-box-containing protein